MAKRKDQPRPMSPEEVQAHAAQIVELPPFEDGTPFVARLRRVSLMGAIAGGKLPNTLLPIAWKALKGELKPTAIGEENPQEMQDFLNFFCSLVLVEPAWDEVRELLTDEQVMAILAYAQAGVRALESFRQQSGADPAAGGSGEGVELPAEQPDPGARE